MTFSQFIAIVRARWVLIASLFAVTVAITFVVSILLPKQYEATATVMVDARPDPVSGMMSMGVVQQSAVLATQVDIIKSAAVAGRVVRNLQLDSSPDLRARWEKEAKAKGDFNAWVATVIGKGLDVKPARESNVLEIKYEGGDPRFSAALANAFAQAYIQSTIQIRVDPARQYADFFEERTKMARAKLEEAQARLTAMQKEKGIIVTDERLDVEMARLSELSTQITGLRMLKAESGSRSNIAQNNPDRVQDVLNNSVIASLKAELARQQGRLDEISSRFGDAHPQVVEARANIDSLKQQIRQETSKVTTSVALSNNVNTSRESMALKAYEEQRARVLKMKDDRAELQVLEREVESAQKIYDSIQARLSQTNLESNSNQAGVYLLSPATEPTKHSSPRLLINLIVASTFGTFLGLIVALAVEMLNPRVRGPVDITQALDLPVLGILPAPQAESSPWKRVLAKRTSAAALPAPEDSLPAIAAN